MRIVAGRDDRLGTVTHNKCLSDVEVIGSDLEVDRPDLVDERPHELEANGLPRAGWISALLLEWLRKQCSHPAQGLAAAASMIWSISPRGRMCKPYSIPCARSDISSRFRAHVHIATASSMLTWLIPRGPNSVVISATRSFVGMSLSRYQPTPTQLFPPTRHPRPRINTPACVFCVSWHVDLEFWVADRRAARPSGGPPALAGAG